jgi:Protein of unknown function (DUF642)
MKTNTTSGLHAAARLCARWGMGMTGCLGGMLAGCLTVHASEGLLENPGFEGEFAGWAVSGNIALRSSAPYPAAEGTRLAVFNAGNTPPNGVLSQSFATVPGRVYGVSFALGTLAYNNYSQKLGVEVRGTGLLASKSFPLSGANGSVRWVTRGFQFTADSDRATLWFRDRSTTTRSIDLLLDAVMVVPPPTHTLTVDVNPTAAGLVISPPDEAGAANGNAGAGFGPLSRIYSEGTETTVTVPELLWSSSYPDKALVYRFTGWTLDGNPAGTELSIQVTMNGDHSLMATYAPSPPIITRQPEDVVVPYGGTAVFTVEAIGSSDMNYEWKFNGGTFQSGSSNTAVLTNAGSDYDGAYEVIVSNAAGSTRSRGATLLTVGAWVTNGDFEYGFSTWTVAGNVRVQATADDPRNRYVAAFNTGNSLPNGSLEQSVATKPGATYRLTFDLGTLAYNTAEQHMGITVRGAAAVADAVISIYGSGYGRTYWERRTIYFTADSEVSHIRFIDRSLVTKAIDLLLDNVRVDEVR